MKALAITSARSRCARSMMASNSLSVKLLKGCDFLSMGKSPGSHPGTWPFSIIYRNEFVCHPSHDNPSLIHAPDRPGILTFCAASVAVADTGGFTAAGERIGLTQSGISVRIRKLEERLGGALLARTSRFGHADGRGRAFFSAMRPDGRSQRRGRGAPGRRVAARADCGWAWPIM
jgi:hypothetical protein